MMPLQGLRVLDLSRALAGPIVGRIMSDLGADVVKVEPPEGDVTRHIGIRRGEQTGYYAQQNAGKRNVCVDLRSPGGPGIVRRLAAAADVVVENFRPGVLAAFGLDWEHLAADHPELVMLSISGFGQEGPERDRAAYAGVLHAESGLVLRQAAVAGSRLTDVQLSVADTNAGLHGMIAILAALRVRDATGLGQHIDIAMTDTLMFCDDFLHWTLDGGDAPLGRGEIWETAGGPFMIMGGFQFVWKSASVALHLADPSPRGASLEEKIEARRRAFADYLISLGDRESVIAALDAANIAWGVVKATEEALRSPTVRHRGSLVAINDRAGGTRQVVQSPYRFSASDAGIRGSAPTRGEHNEEVLAEWSSFSDGEIATFVADRALLHEGSHGGRKDD
jgi:CoA:oxalate CoA-transferase